MKINIRLLYLYLFSFVGLVVSVFGSVQLIDLGLKVYLFKGADRYDYARPVVFGEGANVSSDEVKLREAEEERIREQETVRQRQRDASNAMALLLVGLPLYKYHWRIIQKEFRESKK